jgi:hypothetical protein
MSHMRMHAIHPEIQPLEERQLLSFANALPGPIEHSQPMLVQPLLVSHHPRVVHRHQPTRIHHLRRIDVAARSVPTRRAFHHPTSRSTSPSTRKGNR